LRSARRRENLIAQILKLQFDLVIFDCDGVLVDSEVMSCCAHAKVLTRHGYPISVEQVFDRFLGRSTRQARLEIEAELGRSLPDDFHTQLQDELFQAFAATLETIPHIDQALAAIAQPVCVASSGSQQRMRVSLGRTGLYDKFAPHIFSAAQVEHGKPAPDLFLFAAAQMATAPERCLVIEDSIAGITAARAAGMTVLGFHGGSHCRPGYGDTLRTAGAAMTFDDMRQLPGLIRAIEIPPSFQGAAQR
jgi:HAD superfamily hydrolase (TIGR01509 family)